MLPYFRTEKNNGLVFGANASYSLRDCGHKSLEFKLDLLWWHWLVGVEFQ